MSAKMNVPELRFKEFSGEWEEKKLANISLRTAKKNRENDINSVFTNSATDGIVNQRDYFDKDIANQNNLEGYYIVETDDFIYNPRISTFAPVGPLNRNHLGCGVMSPLYTVFSIVDKNVNLDFIERYFRTTKWHRYMCNIANYGARSDRMNITNSDLFKMPIPLPQKPEQQKIASFLSSVDTKIEQLTKKKTLLEQYKKGVMQKIFSQKLRFRDDDGVEYPEWVEKKLGEVAECLDNLRKPLNDEERQKIKGNIPYWGANNIMGYVNDYLFDETIVLLAEDGGNFNEYKTRPIANISYGKCWVNNHTHVLRGKKNILINEFLFYSLVHKNITAYVSGGTRAKLTKGEMLKIKIDMPTLNEQSKIANFLSSIDTKISQTEQQLEATKQFKKALLQKMFV